MSMVLKAIQQSRLENWYMLSQGAETTYMHYQPKYVTTSSLSTLGPFTQMAVSQSDIAQLL